MRVLQLGPVPPPEGGVSTNMLAIRDALIARGNECELIATTRGKGTSRITGVHRPTSPIQFLRLLSSLRCDVVHLHIGGDVSARVLGLAFLTTLFGRGKKVLTLHSGAYPLTAEARSARRSSIRGFIFRRFDRVIAVNEALADVFRRYGVEHEKLRIILPHVLKRPDPNVAIPAALDDFIRDHSPILLSVGGLEHDYDPLLQVAAMRKIVQSHPNAGLLMVGDGGMRKAVEYAVANSGAADNVCIAGNVDHEVTLHLIQKCGILLRTTLFDGDAISIREALFLRRPVIATDNKMRPEGVHVIPIRDEDTLVSAVDRVLDLPKTKPIIRPDDNSNIDAVIDLYEELV